MSSTKYPKLLSPITLGDLTLRNRVVMAPLTRGRAGEGYTANSVMGTYYKQRASAGLVISEGTHTSLVARGWLEAPEVYTSAHASAWKAVVDGVHERGGVMFCQLWHTGRASHSSFREGMVGFDTQQAAKGVAPSPVKRKSEKGTQGFTPCKGEVEIEIPRELTIAEIEALPEEYRNAAQRSKEAGFDGVELHSANGYLLDEFLQSCSNKRTDAYGGSLENRFRVVDAVLKGIFQVYEPSRVGLRLSPNGAFNGMGSPDNREAFLYFAERLAAYGLGYLHVMIGLGFGFHGEGEPLTMVDIRKVYPGVMIANVGYDAGSAEKEISSGDTDMVAFGRPYISNPDLVERFAKGAELAAPKGVETWYSTVEYRPVETGYSDYPTMEEELKAQT